MSWEPREENVARFEELDSQISFAENELRRCGVDRNSMRPDLLRMSTRFQALIDLICDAELVDRDELNLNSMIIELDALQRTLEEAKKQAVKSNILLPPRMDIPRG